MNNQPHLNNKQKYQSLVTQEIPIAKYMGWHITQLSPFNIQTNVQLQPNINVHKTAFAGSIYAACMATGWTLLKCWYDHYQFSADLVAAEANIKYFAPVAGDFECFAHIDRQNSQYKKLESRLSQNQSCAFTQKIDLKHQLHLCASMEVIFVFKC